MRRKWSLSHFSVLLQSLLIMTSFIDWSNTVTANLNACLLVERGTQNLFYSFERSAAAVELAVQYANDVILYRVGISLNTTYTDIGSTCEARNHLVAHAMGLRDRGTICDVYIGPGCGSAAESLYDYTRSIGAFIIGSPAAGVGISAPREKYNYMGRISITHQNNANIILQFLHQQNYSASTIICDLYNSFYKQLSTLLENQMRTTDQKYYSISKFVQVDSSQITTRAIETILKTNSARSRVFILCIPSAAVRSFMLVASDLGFTAGEHVYLGVNLFPSTTWGNFSYSTGDDRDDAS
ncbi:hypothetical protein RvY_13082-2 [Ramazzottius varieornatus]|uniref:Receptor ligand binding region domain-containing protein n=1 Tax=Ramazzottius varieornatus TaxID=947166 RepID=A0A1D1VQR9_RAMVA|nr:hypothetical protein RvY_13082-2 [Ramazzottius varieornatus]